MGKNPFDRVHLGYDALFPSRTFFFHLHPESNNSERTLMQEIRIPVLQAATDGETGFPVEIGTLVAISIGFLWVLWQLVSGLTPRSPENKKER